MPVIRRRLHVRLDEEVFDFLRQFADSRHKTMSAVVVDLLMSLQQETEQQSSSRARQW